MKMITRLMNVFKGKASRKIESFEFKNIPALIKNLEDDKIKSKKEMQEKVVNIHRTFLTMEQRLKSNRSKAYQLDAKARQALNKAHGATIPADIERYKAQAAEFAYKYEYLAKAVDFQQKALAKTRESGERLTDDYTKIINAYDTEIDNLKMKAQVIDIEDELNSIRDLTTISDSCDLLKSLQSVKKIVDEKEILVKAQNLVNEVMPEESPIDDILSSLDVQMSKEEALERLYERTASVGGTDSRFADYERANDKKECCSYSAVEYPC